MVLDPTKHADWEIAEEAESRMKTCYELADELGVTKDELLPHAAPIDAHDYRAQLCEVYLARGDVLESHRVFREMAPERPVDAASAVSVEVVAIFTLVGVPEMTCRPLLTPVNPEVSMMSPALR